MAAGLPAVPCGVHIPRWEIDMSRTGKPCNLELPKIPLLNGNSLQRQLGRYLLRLHPEIEEHECRNSNKISGTSGEFRTQLRILMLYSG